jgi:cold shock CspA family protein
MCREPVSEYFYGDGRKAALHRKPLVPRLPERRGVSTIGRIVKLLVGQGHGFIRMRDDREIYFHRSDVRDRASFNDFVVGDAVSFELLDDAVSGARALRVRRRPGR